jgi:hypothetical protein
MADVTRRTFLKGVGGAAASGAVPGKPLLDFLLKGGQNKSQQAVSILHKLMQAREQGVDRYPIIYEALKEVGIDFDNIYEKTRLPEGMTFKDKPLFGRSELDDEIGLEQQIMMDAQGLFNPDEPQAWPTDAMDLAQYLDVNLPPDFKGERTQDDINAEFKARLDAAHETERARGINQSLGPDVSQVFEDREDFVKTLETDAFKEREAKLQQHIFDTDPFYDYERRREEEAEGRRQADIARKKEITYEDVAADAPQRRSALLDALSILPQGRLVKGAFKGGKALLKYFMKTKAKPPAKKEAVKPQEPLQLEHKPQETFDIKPIKEAEKVRVPRTKTDDEIPF